MVNFRGFRDKTIDFNDKSVVLLSAANGIGKTTTIDAIEWCLTGEIGRLKTAFNNRSTNESDRKQNTNGILKHRDSSNTSKVQVYLWIMDDENENILCREQKKDELNPDVSKVTLNGNENEANALINMLDVVFIISIFAMFKNHLAFKVPKEEILKHYSVNSLQIMMSKNR